MKKNYSLNILLLILILFAQNIDLVSKGDVYLFMNKNLCFNCRTVNLNHLISKFKDNDYRVILAPQSIDKIEEKAVREVLEESIDYDTLDFNCKYDGLDNNNLKIVVENENCKIVYDNVNNDFPSKIVLGLAGKDKTNPIDEADFQLLRHPYEYTQDASNFYFLDGFQKSILKYNIKENKFIKAIKFDDNPYKDNFTEDQQTLLKSINFYYPMPKQLFEIDGKLFADYEIYHKAEADDKGEMTYLGNHFLFKIQNDSLQFVKQVREKFEKSYYAFLNSYMPISEEVYFSEFYSGADYQNKKEFNERIALIDFDSSEILDSVTSKRATNSSAFGYTSKAVKLPDNAILYFNYNRMRSSVHVINDNKLKSNQSDIVDKCDSIIRSVILPDEEVRDNSIIFAGETVIVSFLIHNKKTNTNCVLLIGFYGDLEMNFNIRYGSKNDEIESATLLSSKDNAYMLINFKNSRWHFEKLY